MVYSNFYVQLHKRAQGFAKGLVALWRFRPSRFYFLTFLLLQALAWWQASFIFRHLSSNILVLHYNVDLGVNLVGDPSQIFIYPLYALGIFILNLIIATFRHQHKYFQFFIHLLLAAALVFALFLNLVLLFIYLINFK